ncbi:aminoacetone oxidase family FAD-binding enzyme, partial [Candidatus Parcubacteria bacterium]|nr:aminoacetone oxidase family FAD-binding enzyme [Candidatus Parcubacteria bacterium]
MSNIEYDIIIIGGGASGMMAASSVGRNKKVLLIEKNNILGKKLLITGGGRCNLTNEEYDLRKLLKNYKKAEQFLYSAFTQYGVKDSLTFFNSRNMPTKVEAYGRVFPVSDSARSVYNVLVKEIKNKNIEVLSDAKVLDILHNTTTVTGVEVEINKKKIIYTAQKYILATGGTSHPETGSTGDAYAWLKSMGHTVHTPKPSLVPVKSNDVWLKKLQGVVLQDIKIRIFADGEKKNSKKGKILFTHFGISGPTVLNMSKEISDYLNLNQKVYLGLDILPGYDHGTLNKTLTDLFQTNSKKKISNILPEIVNKNLIPIILQNTKIDEGITGNAVTKEMRMALIEN